MKDTKTYNLFLRTGFIEGISYLLLLFVCMPLKYWADMPMPVRIVGMIHGVLFVAFCILLLMATLEYRWGVKKAVIAFVLSIIPFGTFYLHRLLRQG